MRISVRASFTFAAAAGLLAGCGMHGMSGSGSVEAIDGHVQTAVQAETAHATSMRGASTLATAQRVEVSHCDDIDEHFDSMRAVCDEMMSCAGSQRGNVQAALDLADQARRDCAAHAGIIGAAKDLDGVTAEEARYAGVVGRFRDSWSNLRGSMMSGGGMMCGRGGMM